MVRTPLTPQERERGRSLGTLLRLARGERSMAEVAAEAGISAETLRKIETGRAPTPAFFTIAALAAVLGLALDEVAARCATVAEPGAEGAVGAVGAEEAPGAGGAEGVEETGEMGKAEKTEKTGEMGGKGGTRPPTARVPAVAA